MSKTKLFCLPYAGGASTIFSPWFKYLDKNIELIPIELTGRGSRLLDPLYKDYDDMIDDIFSFLKEHIGSDYAIFGHSLGGYAAYDVVRKLQVENLQIPRHVFLSGVRAPHLISFEKKYQNMEEEEFKEVIKKVGATPPEFFDYPELLELFLPVLMNDFKMLETREMSKEILPLESEITVLLGTDESSLLEQNEAWNIYSSKKVCIELLEGGHFFLNHHPEKLVNILNKSLTQ